MKTKGVWPSEEPPLSRQRLEAAESPELVCPCPFPVCGKLGWPSGGGGAQGDSEMEISVY